jgi:hypothetical protein
LPIQIPLADGHPGDSQRGEVEHEQVRPARSRPRLVELHAFVVARDEGHVAG